MTRNLNLARNLHHFLMNNLFYPIILSTIMVFGFFAIRVQISNKPTYFFMLWNLFLAWMPYFFSLIIAALQVMRPKWRFLLVIPAVGWMAFLPNALYITTDFIHLAERGNIPLWYDAGFITLTAWTGIFLAVASLHTVHGIIKTWLNKFWGWVFALGMIALSGFGVYLGRFPRWNSWDIISAPKEIIYDSIDTLLNPLTNADKIGFMVMYTSLFLVTYLTFAWIRPFTQTTSFEKPEVG